MFTRRMGACVAPSTRKDTVNSTNNNKSFFSFFFSLKISLGVLVLVRARHKVRAAAVILALGECSQERRGDLVARHRGEPCGHVAVHSLGEADRVAERRVVVRVLAALFEAALAMRLDLQASTRADNSTPTTAHQRSICQPSPWWLPPPSVA